MRTAFERLIDPIRAESSVMEIGYAGLGGDNTTNWIRNKFSNVTGICKDEHAVRRYLDATHSIDQVIFGEYPKDMPDKKWDVLVVDTNIEGCVAFWSKEGMNKAASYLNPHGYAIAYIMLDKSYGDANAVEMQRKHWEQWWMPILRGHLPDVPFSVVGFEQEERRKEIIWVLLQHE